MPVEVYVGLGSNVEPRRYLSDAIEALERVGPLALSPVYRNPAVGFSGDDFLNLVVRVRTERAPADIEQLLCDAERSAGRRCRHRSPGPRTLDLDLLLYGSMVDPQLRLPRADILSYPFVLRPLAELAPELVHPVTGITMAAAWRAMADLSPPMQKLPPLMSPPQEPGHGADTANT